MNILACPNCKGDLLEISNGKKCPSCNKEFFFNNDVLSLLSEKSFEYEVKPEDWDDYAWEMIEVARGKNRTKKVLKYIPQEGLHLDIGIGRGDGTFEISKKKETIGIDFGSRSLSVAKEKNRSIYQADARKLPFKDSSFSSITLLDVIEHIPEPDLAVNEIFRVLMPGGVLILQTPSIESIQSKIVAINLYKSYKTIRFIDVIVNKFRKTPVSLNKNIGIQPYDEELSRDDIFAIIKNNGFKAVKHKLVNYYVPQFFIQIFSYADLYICKKN